MPPMTSRIVVATRRTSARARARTARERPRACRVESNRTESNRIARASMNDDDDDDDERTGGRAQNKKKQNTSKTPYFCVQYVHAGAGHESSIPFHSIPFHSRARAARRARCERDMSSAIDDALAKYACGDSDDSDEDARGRANEATSRDARRCLNCGVAHESLLTCSRCRRAYFCNATCQRAVWSTHSVTCVADPRMKAVKRRLEPPRVPTAEEKARAKASERRKIEEEVIPRGIEACEAGVRGQTLDDAIEALEDAIVFAIGEEDETLTASVRVTLSRAYLTAKRFDECLHYLAPALERAKREGGAESARVHALAARVHAAKGEKEQCRKELTATLDCASESTSDEAQFESLFDAGMILHDIGDWERCAPLLSTAAEAAEKLGKIAHAARAYNRSGSALFRSGRPDYAARCWIRELKTLESDESSASGVLAQAHGNVASALLLAGGDAEAFNLHRESALAKAREASADDEARVYLQLGNAYKLASDALDDGVERATECFEKAKSLSTVDVVGDVASRALETLRL